MKINQSSGGVGESLFTRQATGWFRGVAAIMVVASHYAEWWSWFMPTEGSAELLRQALTKLGGYGVSLFFLFSGYGLVKSLEGRRMNGLFIYKRFVNVWLPYFLLVGAIELLSGGFISPSDFLSFLVGYDYWYMMVLFLFYLAFMLLWALPCPRWLRVLLLAVWTFLFSRHFYIKNMLYFWYASNAAFVLGVIAAEYEKAVRKAVKIIAPVLLPLLACAMFFIIRSGLGMNVHPIPETETALHAWARVGAEAVWTLLILLIASLWRHYDRILIFVGKNSLYIYLTHTFIFMRCVNTLTCGFAARFAVSAVLTLIVSMLCGFLFSALPGLLLRLSPFSHPTSM